MRRMSFVVVLVASLTYITIAEAVLGVGDAVYD
jgi:hypothetical protein